ncbi:PTS ascorbate transporter subunit IIC [Paratissierella segnis]|uniref:Ascorbate-specific PTS system EIIC component n=1 Tax=Paratissierella segnis TaxID=2763679 RepID=A0A926ILS6_9FIRM|nr:PTS ascorbate transporter subunit IIC [Paratissierella segnis]MBC8588958.1 PTS ascorbate transporter subunit IIC [Paratissierella segnis]
MINFIVNVLGDPTIMLGFIALIGLIIQRKKSGDIILGTLKTMMGYLILSAGTGIIGTPINLLTTLVQKGLGVNGVLPLYWAVYSESMLKYGTESALMFIVAFIINIILARFTKWRNLALTVHLQLFWTAFMASVMGGFGLSIAQIVLIGGVFSGIYFWISTTISAHYAKPLTDEHCNFVPSSIGIIIAGESGRLFKKNSKSAEEISFPKSLNWMKDSIMSTSVAFLILNFVFVFVAGISVTQEIAESTPWIVYVILQSLTFGGGIAVILYGVRMMLAELIPAFAGVAEKILPNAKLGLDYPTIFPYGGTAVMIGFVSSLVGSVCATLVMSITGFSPVVLPGVQINFFEGALIGVYANAHGGYKNAVFSAFVTGFLLQYMVAFTFPFTGHLVATGGAYEAIDFNTIGLLFIKIFSLFK